MSRILGLDLGTNSVGWAVVDTDNKTIEDVGVRIFTEGVEKKTIGSGDKEKTNNATRTENRQKRRHFYRKRLRKIKLLELLVEQNMCPLDLKDLKQWKNWDKQLKAEGKKFPSTEKFVEWIRLDPYDLRAKALSEILTLEEFGRILYHLIQRRGFLSSRKGNDDPTTLFEKGNPNENILPINVTKSEADLSSLGHYLSSVTPQINEPYKTIRDENGVEIRARGRYTTREMYVAEFEQIWQVQAKALGLDTIEVTSKKVRELKGALSGKRNADKLANLQKKYGVNNVEVIEKDDNNSVTRVITYTKQDLKTTLGGHITEVVDGQGQKVMQFKSNESVLFWQRPLRSQKGLIANCRFENELPVIDKSDQLRLNEKGEVIKRSKKPCPISHPEFELFRAYQFINNIKYGSHPRLTDEERSRVLNLLNKKGGDFDKKGGNFDFELIPKELKLTYEQFNYDAKFKVAGNTTIKQLSNLFEAKVWEEHYEDIWHCFYFYDDTEKLYDKLVKDYGLKKTLKDVANVKLKDGYSNVSLKAIRNMLPFLIKGRQYDKAVVLGGVKNAFGNKRWGYFEESHEQIERDILKILSQPNKEGEAIEKVKDYLSDPENHFGFLKDDLHFQHLYHHSQDVQQQEQLSDHLPLIENLRNPIVQQGLHETRRLVNRLMVEYRQRYGNDFHFDRIHVEMGRDLRNSRKQRQEMGFRIAKNEAKNEEARQRLTEFGLQSSRQNIHKYLLYKEIEERNGTARCPYTGKTISITNLLGGINAIQVEHIIPYSISLDDAFGNKTLSEATFNGLKGEKTPYQFYQENSDPKLWGESSWEDVKTRAFRLLPYAKAKRFTAEKNFEKSSFVERQLNDTRYIAKKTVEILSHICDDVRVMPGQLTAELRHLWGLNNVLQQTQNLGDAKFTVETEYATPYYVVTNEAAEVQALYRKVNEKPSSQANELQIPGELKKGTFASKYYNIDITNTDLKDGKYWAKLSVSDKIKLVPKYIDKPESDDNSIIFRGQVEKNVFKNDTTGNRKIVASDGVYWAKFEIVNRSFELPQKDKQPKPKANQLLLFGNVSMGTFKCYIYQCQTNMLDGKYWVLLDINPASIEFVQAINEVPKVASNEICITASVDDDGLLVADCDTDYRKQTEYSSGKYYLTLAIESKNPEFVGIENPAPKIEKGQQLVEGHIWVDKYTGEIKFDPKKNRDDHRHHAIDAITIALTEQSYLNKLSAENARRKNRERNIADSTEHFPEPWNGFNADVQKAVNAILISFKKNNKTLTKNKKGLSVRGQLHKENVFGKHKAPQQKEDAFHRRTKITDIENNKDIEKVVDVTIREHIKKHLSTRYGIDTNAKKYDVPKDAFYKAGEWQLFLKNTKGGEAVPIKKVRIKENIGNAQALKSDVNQYVNPRNNHHVMLYTNLEGKLCESIVSFWTVIERQKQGLPIYQLPPEGAKVVATLEINDLYIIGLSNEDFDANRNNATFLSAYLYRVQKVSSMYYTFRFHLASTVLINKQECSIRSFGAWHTANPIKVMINELGKIKKTI